MTKPSGNGDMPKRNLCCGVKPKMTAIQYGYKDSDSYYFLICPKCGRKSGGKECYSERECVELWNKDGEKNDAWKFCEEMGFKDGEQ